MRILRKFQENVEEILGEFSKNLGRIFTKTKENFKESSEGTFGKFRRNFGKKWRNSE